MRQTIIHITSFAEIPVRSALLKISMRWSLRGFVATCVFRPKMNGDLFLTHQRKFKALFGQNKKVFFFSVQKSPIVIFCSNLKQFKAIWGRGAGGQYFHKYFAGYLT